MAYMVIEQLSHGTKTTYGNYVVSCDLPHLPLKRVIKDINNKHFPNGQIMILNFQEIPKDTYDEWYGI